MATGSGTTASSDWPAPVTTAMTRSPGPKRRQPGPASTTSPASSRPGRSGGVVPGGGGYIPARCIRSPRHTPAAFTATSSSPAPGTGSGCSRHTSAPSTMVTACMARLSSWSALLDGQVGPLGRPDVELARAGDLLVLLEQLDPVRQPARHPGDGEQHREHLGGEVHGLVDQAGVEVDVGVELPRDEVVVGQRHLLELERDVEQRVAAGDLEHLVRGLLDDLGPRVVALVHAVAEALELDLAGLHPLDVGVDLVERADLAQHGDDRLVGAAVAGAVEGGRGAGHAAVGVGMRRCDRAHGRGPAVLL